MPFITVKALEGRSTEQKRGLVRDITEAVAKNFKVKPEDVSVDIIEYRREDMASGGKLYSDR